MVDVRRFSPVVSVLALGALTACGQNGFIYYEKNRPANTVSFVQNVREISGSSAVDILWIIDNSGSMSEHQRSVINNTDVFIRNFTASSTLDWRMGLISTDPTEQPYVGFSSRLDKTTPDPVGVFQRAVGALGTDGSAQEETLRPLINVLTRYPDFNRPDTPLAIMMVTDAEEQSRMSFPNDFFPRFQAAIGASNRYFAYGVLNASDFGCDGESGSRWRYAGSPYESLITNAYIGKVFPLCQANFGQTLAEIGKEIVKEITHPTIHLNDRPKPQTIVVAYKGTPLPAGTTSEGGYWLYDFDRNAIVFGDLSFSQGGSTDSVTVTYDIDDGF